MKLFDADVIAVQFPEQNPYTRRTHIDATINQQCGMFEINEIILDIQEASHLPIESDLYLHYCWKLKQIDNNKI